MTKLAPEDSRTRWALVALPMAVGMFSAGCSVDRTGRREVSTAIEGYALERINTAEAYAQAPQRAERSSASRPVTIAPQSTSAPSTLRDFIVRALDENPSIKAAEETALAKAERIVQATALPDPLVTAKVLPEPVRTAEGDSFLNLGVRQKLPVPQKLDARGRMAREEALVALERLRQTRLGVIADLKRAYFRLYVLDKSLEITSANQELLRGLIDVARAQVASGRRRQDDVLRAQTELSTLEADLIGLRQRRVSVTAKLNQLLGRDSASVIESPADFDVRSAELAVESLMGKAIAANPELKRFEHQIERDQHAVELARLARWPDFTFGFEWMQMDPRGAFEAPRNPVTGLRPTTPQLSEDGSDNWAITFGFNLPIWFDKIEAGVEEARRNLSASRQRLKSAQDRVSFQVTDALERVRSQRDLAALFADTIIPQAEQTYQVSQASYAAGASDFLYVIDNWRKWLAFTIQYHRSLGELERSVADLELALGMSLSEAGEP